MAQITLRFIASRGFVPTAIRWVTNSLFSHVELGTPEGTWIGAHAKGGVQERAADYTSPLHSYVYRIPCADQQATTLLANARDAIGTQYNFWDILGLLIRSRRLTSSNRVICSQFVTEQLLLIGIRPLNVLPQFAYLITPETLHLSPLLIGNKDHDHSF